MQPDGSEDGLPQFFLHCYLVIIMVGVKVVPNKASEIKRVMNSVQASMAVEGLKPSKRAKAISQKYLEGKLDSEEAVNMITAHHTAKRKSR